MINALKRMIESKKYTVEYMAERVNNFYLVGDINDLQFFELKLLLKPTLIEEIVEVV